MDRRAFLRTGVAGVVAGVPGQRPHAFQGNGENRPETSFSLHSTPLFRKEGGLLRQMALLQVPGDIQHDAIVTIQGSNFKKSSELSALERLTTGTLGFNPMLLLELTDTREAFLFPVPEIRTPTQVTATINNGRSPASRNVTLDPRPKWEIRIIHSTHTDAGYTDIPERVRRQLAGQYREVLSACRRTDHFPPESRFHWVVEAFLPLEDFWQEASEAEHAELLKYIREERIEVTVAYVPHLSEVAGHESFLRFFYPAAQFARTHEIPLRSAMFSDSTGYAWIVPQVLRSMGIRYLSTAVNSTRALNPFDQLARPIYWESPDGSRVLLWNSDPRMAYPEGYQLRLAHSYDAALPLVTAYLEKLYASGFHSPQLGLRAAQDNQGPAASISETIRDWNAHWEYPRLIFSTNYEFLKTLEERHASEIPVYRAAWPDWWSDYYISAAQATGVLREGHEWLSTAEKLSALARLAGRSGRSELQSLKVARQRILLSDEPLWGYAFAVDRPRDWRTGGATVDKINDIYVGAVNAKAVANQANQALFSAWLDERTVVAFNPLSWARDAIVRLELPRGYGPGTSGLAKVMGVRDLENGQEALVQVVHSDRLGTSLEFAGQNIPPLGYRVYELLDRAPAALQSSPVQVDGETIENEFYRVRLDPQKGVIASIYDKEFNRELVDRSAPYGFNQYVYEQPLEGDFKQVWGGEWWLDTIRNRDWLKPAKVERFAPGPARLKAGRRGPVSYSLILESSARLTPMVRQEIILYPSVKRIDIVNTLHKEKVLTAEAAYFAFPFAFRNAVVCYEGIDTIITPEHGQLPLSARDWYAVQHWVKLSDESLDVVWTPLESPLVQFGEIRTQHWTKKLNITNGSLFSFLLSNYWMTDVQPSQGGEMIFRYSFTSRKRDPGRVACTRFGWERMAPVTVAGPLMNPGFFLPPSRHKKETLGKFAASFCEISEPNVLLIIFKEADEGDGCVLRLLEFQGKATSARVRFGSRPVTGVAPLSAVEQTLSPADDETLKASQGAIHVDLKPFELRTLRVEFAA